MFRSRPSRVGVGVDGDDDGDGDARGRNTEEWSASEEIFAAASDGNVSRLEDLVSKGAKVGAQVAGMT